MKFLFVSSPVVEEESTAFVDMEHSYCLPRSNSQENVDEKPTAVTPKNYLDHDYASSPLSPVKPQSPKKTPLKDRNRIVNNHKIDEFGREKKCVFRLLYWIKIAALACPVYSNVRFCVFIIPDE